MRKGGWLQGLIDDLEAVEIDRAVTQCAIALRRDHRLKLPDALIAATAIIREAVLLTNLPRSRAGSSAQGDPDLPRRTA